MSQPVSERPLVSFVLLAYNQPRFVEEAVKGALAQTYRPLEIIVSDDCSSDGTFEIIRQILDGYRGPHTVVARRNERNLGIGAHVTRAMDECHGEIIVAAAGDDVSLPDRVTETVVAFLSSSDVHCAFAQSWIDVDSEGARLGESRSSLPIGRVPGVDLFGRLQLPVPGHSSAWRREVFDRFGPLRPEVCSEDVAIPFRASLLGRVSCFPGPVVRRRLHTGNVSRVARAASMKERLEWRRHRERSTVSNRIGILRGMVDDLARLGVASRLTVEQRDDLRRDLGVLLASAERERDYLDATRFRRAELAWKAVLADVPLARVGRWILQYDLPALYGRAVPLLNRWTARVLALRLRGRPPRMV